MCKVLDGVLIINHKQPPAHLQKAWNNAFCDLLKSEKYREEAVKEASRYVLGMDTLRMFKDKKIDIPGEFTFANIIYQST